MPTKPERQRVSLYIDRHIVQQAKVASVMTGRTLSDVAADAFAEFATSATQKSAAPLVKTPR